MITRPLVLMGDARTPDIERLRAAYGWGRIFVERKPTPTPGEPWALDNGAYSAYRRGLAPDFDAFFHRLQTAMLAVTSGSLHPPRFVVTPDLINQGNQSLRFSHRWADHIHAQFPDTPLFLPVGDNADPATVTRLLPPFDGLFLAGSDAFKAGLNHWLAPLPPTRLHYARCSTPDHVARAAQLRCESLDTAYPFRYKPALLPFLTAWLQNPHPR